MIGWMSKIENRVVVWACVTVLAITANLITTSFIVAFVVSAEERAQARTGRLATAITRVSDQVNRELKIAADDLDHLVYLNRYPWTRNEMAEFCLEFEKLNADLKVRCPDVIELSPELNLLNPRKLPVTPNLNDE